MIKSHASIARCINNIGSSSNIVILLAKISQKLGPGLVYILTRVKFAFSLACIYQLRWRLVMLNVGNNSLSLARGHRLTWYAQRTYQPTLYIYISRCTCSSFLLSTSQPFLYYDRAIFKTHLNFHSFHFLTKNCISYKKWTRQNAYLIGSCYFISCQTVFLSSST